MDERKEFTLKSELVKFIRKNFVLEENQNNPIINEFVYEKADELFGMFIRFNK